MCGELGPETVTVAFVKCSTKKSFGSRNGLLSASFLLDALLGLGQLLIRWEFDPVSKLYLFSCGKFGFFPLSVCPTSLFLKFYVF